MATMDPGGMRKYIIKTDDDNYDDRRKYKRFTIEDGLFLINNTGPSGIGTVLDIGMGGLSFRSITLGLFEEKHLYISIFSTSKPPLKIKNIPCDIVHCHTNYDSIYTSSVKHMGLKFVNLTTEQTDSMKTLLESLAS
jgi:hypothetical protein